MMMLIKFVDNFSLQVVFWIVIFTIYIFVEVFTKKNIGFIYSGCAVLSMALAIFNVKYIHQVIIFILLSSAFIILAKWKFIKASLINFHHFIQNRIDSTPETDEQDIPKV